MVAGALVQLGVDLSAVVSKYSGDTEKNLSEVFAAAETGCAISSSTCATGLS